MSLTFISAVIISH